MVSVELVGLDTVMVAIEKSQLPGGVVDKGSIKLVGNLAVSGRNILRKTFTSQTGELRYNSPDRPRYSPKRWNPYKGRYVDRHREPLGHGPSGFYDVRGPDAGRLIKVSLKGRGVGNKAAALSSHPMNLWERNTKTGRPGKWILTVRLAPMVERQVPRHANIVEKEMAEMLEKDMRGQP